MEWKTMAEETCHGENEGRRTSIAKPSGPGSKQSRRPHLRRQPFVPSLLARTGGTAVSARKLGAELWEIQELRRPQMYRMMTDRSSPLYNDEPPADLSGVTTPGSNRGAQCAAPSVFLHRRTARKSPPSPASSDSSMHFAASSRSTAAPSCSLNLGGRIDNGLKTSPELLRVMNRICSLEEQHASNLVLIRSLKLELKQAMAEIEDLSLERSEGQGMVWTAIRSAEEELQWERRLRRRTESQCRQLAGELSGAKASYSGVLENLERERKTRELLESLCDEFADGIRRYEEEVRELRQKSGRECGHGRDRPELHIAEDWLGERIRIKLAGARGDMQERDAILERLTSEIESFVRSRCRNSSRSSGFQAGFAVDHSFFPRRSPELSHLDGAGDDDDDDVAGSVSGGVHSFEFRSETPFDNGYTAEKKQGGRVSDSHGRINRLSSDPSCSRQIQPLKFPRRRNSPSASDNTLRAKLLEARTAAKHAGLRPS